MHSIRSGYRIGTSYWWKHWLSWRTYWNWVVWYYQRATRGYADCDTWSLDDYLNEWLPNALRLLAMNKIGIPSQVFEDGDFDECGGCSDEAMKRASDIWHYILCKIIVGFEANKRMMQDEYDAELGPYPYGDLSDLNDFNNPLRRALVKERIEAEKPLRERDQKLFEEGMVLFTKYYNSLWD